MAVPKEKKATRTRRAKSNNPTHWEMVIGLSVEIVRLMNELDAARAEIAALKKSRK